MKSKIIILASLLILIFFGCMQEDKKDYVLRDVWKLEQAQINSFDPLDAFHAFHIQLVKQLFNTLTDLDSLGNIVPSLAKSWESEDGKNWLFHLRDDVFFIDDECFISKEERKFVAQDVQFSFERLLHKDSESMGISYFKNIMGFDEFNSGRAEAIKGIKIKDNYTIQFELKNADYSFPNLLSLPYISIVKKLAIEAYNPKKKPIGTGPFQLKIYEADQLVHLLKNQDYWARGEKNIPIVEEVKITLTTDANHSFMLFRNQRTDFLELNLPLLRQYENTTFAFDVHKEVFETAQLNFYLFNLDNIKSADVRKGINYAIDRERLQQLLGDNGIITKSLYPAMFSELSKPRALLSFQPEKAKQLLIEPMRLRLVTFDDILSRSMANQIRADLARYNITIEVEAVPFSVLVDRLTSDNYDIIQLYWGMLFADVNHFLTPFKTTSHPPVGNNFNRYSNKDFDRLTKLAKGKTDEEQLKFFMEAEEIILNDMPLLPIYYANHIRISNNRFNLPVNPLLYKFYKNATPVEY